MTKRFLFQKILDIGVKESFEPGNTAQSIAWFKEQANKLKQLRPEKIIRSKESRPNQKVNIWRPGELYLFQYDAANKDTLPYYDRFPLVMLMDEYEDGFMGLNFHYLPPMLRAILMDRMYRFLNNDDFDSTTRLLLSYRKLKAMAGRPLYKPCIKRYLNSQVKSRFVKVHPAEWDLVLMLPLDRFAGKPRTIVWRDSKRIYEGQ